MKNELLSSGAVMSPGPVAPKTAIPAKPSPPDNIDPTFWHGFIDERAAAVFLGFTIRCLQGWRYRGGGPIYRKIGRVRYTRAELRTWADERARTSTSNSGAEVNVA